MTAVCEMPKMSEMPEMSEMPASAKSIIRNIAGGRLHIQSALSCTINRYNHDKKYICPECVAHIVCVLNAALTDVTCEVLPRIPRGLLISYCADLLNRVKTCDSQMCNDEAVIKVFREVYMTLYRPGVK
jgi:hypothetical protein